MNIISVVLSLLLLAPLVVAAEENVVGNGRFHQYRPTPKPLSVPTGGAWFPEGWRIAPGPGVASASVYTQPATVGDGYGRVLRIQFSNYNPFDEAGQAWLEHHIFEYDVLIGHALELSWWQKVDGCCVPVVPMLWINYHNGDYEFYGGGGRYLVSQHDVTDIAGYTTRLRASPYCTATTAWRYCAILFPLPTGDGHITDNNRYVAIGMNFRGPTAPTIHLAHMRLVILP